MAMIDFRARLNAFYPLFGLRWALIVLNEFLPDCWRGGSWRCEESWAGGEAKATCTGPRISEHLAAEELQGVTHGE